MAVSPECAAVGELACQRNSYLKTLKTIVVSCEEKAEKKEFEICFQDTILFPAGGGQPSDTGHVLYEGRELQILDVARRGLEAVHTLSEPLPVGSEVELFVDWSTRYDHMQQHTGQHLVSAICDMKELPTLGWYLTKRSEQQPCFVEISKALTEEEMTDLRAQTNQAISQQLRISIKIVDAKDADCDYIPEDYQIRSLGKLREVHIGELDRNFCCGTHLKNTLELRAICIVGQKPGKVKDSSRLFYFVGDRAIDYMTLSASVLYNVRTALCTNIETVEANLAKVQDDRKQLSMVVKEAYRDLAAERLPNIEAELKKNGSFALVHSMTVASDFGDCIQSRIREVCEADKALTFCMVGVPKQAFQGTHVDQYCANYIIIGKDASVLGSALFDRFKPNVKGGGGARKWQGKFVYHKGAEVNEFVRVLKDKLAFLTPKKCFPSVEEGGASRETQNTAN